MCLQNINLVCNEQKCLCIENYYWTGSTCSKKNSFNLSSSSIDTFSLFNLKADQKSINQACTSTSGCLVSLGLLCIGNLCKYTHIRLIFYLLILNIIKIHEDAQLVIIGSLQLLDVVIKDS